MRRTLRLYVSGRTSAAARALESRALLIDACAGDLRIDVIDIEMQPDLAEAASVLATPTLSDETTQPPRRLIGDFGDLAATLEYFGLHSSAANR